MLSFCKICIPKAHMQHMHVPSNMTPPKQDTKQANEANCSTKQKWEPQISHKEHMIYSKELKQIFVCIFIQKACYIAHFHIYLCKTY